MQNVINLIWLTHPAALNAVIFAAENETPADVEAAGGELLAALYLDDTFNEYGESELIAAIAEAINEYV